MEAQVEYLDGSLLKMEKLKAKKIIGKNYDL
jgi:hypothetical protein